MRHLPILFVLVVPGGLFAQDGVTNAKPPAEVLKRYVGSWKIEPAEKDALRQGGSVSSNLILDGAYVESKVKLLASDERRNKTFLDLTTYDPRAKKYRRWRFGPGAFTIESTGTWDAGNQTMTWVWDQPGPDKDTPIRTTDIEQFESGGGYESTSTTAQDKEILYRIRTKYVRENVAKSAITKP